MACDALCTSGFVVDVIFLHSGSMVRRKRNNKDHQVHVVGFTLVVKSALYNCLVTGREQSKDNIVNLYNVDYCAHI